MDTKQLDQAIANFNSHLVAGNGCFTCRAATTTGSAYCPEGASLMADIEQATLNLDS